MIYTSFMSPWGKIKVIRSALGLVSLSFENFSSHNAKGEAIEQRDGDDLLLLAKEQILEYASGKRKSFSLTLDLSSGSEFQKLAWGEMTKIPFGTTSTYGALAKACGSPKGARAMGGAANRNPLPLIIPCHRVMGKNGQLTGFALGLRLKTELLTHEGVLLH